MCSTDGEQKVMVDTESDCDAWDGAGPIMPVVYDVCKRWYCVTVPAARSDTATLRSF